MRYHLFQKFFGKMVKIKETSFLSTRGMYLSCHGCMSLFTCVHTILNVMKAPVPPIVNKFLGAIRNNIS